MTGWIVIVSRGEISLRWKEMEKERKKERGIGFRSMESSRPCGRGDFYEPLKSL